MSAAVTGISVVTTDGVRGRHGRTVSALVSVSADPPLLLACLLSGSSLMAAIRAHGVFGVSVLAEDQVEVAERFAGRTHLDGGRFCFGGIAHAAGATGVPLIEGAAARIECRVVSAMPAGTHTIVVGEVLSAAPGGPAPLAYTARGYARVLR